MQSCVDHVNSNAGTIFAQSTSAALRQSASSPNDVFVMFLMINWFNIFSFFKLDVLLLEWESLIILIYAET